MAVFLILLVGVVAAAIVATFVTLARDGYRRLPTRATSTLGE